MNVKSEFICIICSFARFSIPKNNELESHGEKVVKYFQNINKLDELEIKWRRHFLESMKPQHLPKLWSVNHNPWDSPKSC